MTAPLSESAPSVIISTTANLLINHVQTTRCHTRENGYPLAFSQISLKMDSCFRRNDKKVSL